MEDYPTVATIFMLKLLDSKKLDRFTVGDSVNYVLPGTSPIYKRLIVINSSDSELSFNTATGIAFRTKTLTEVCDWLREEKKWDGAYIQ